MADKNLVIPIEETIYNRVIEGVSKAYNYDEVISRLPKDQKPPTKEAFVIRKFQEICNDCTKFAEVKEAVVPVEKAKREEVDALEIVRDYKETVKDKEVKG